jgi:alkylation response protein AidB-like acyl-CoA dehydrogenase
MSQKKNGVNPSIHPAGHYFNMFNDLLDSKLGKTLNLRKLTEKIVYQSTYNAMRVSNASSRIFKGNGQNKAERLQPQKPSDLFDLNYTEDQQMIRESLLLIATKMRTAAEKIDENFTIPEDLWAEFNELNLAYLQVPESLGGMMKDKGTVTQMMIAETLAYGDLGQALAMLTHHSVLNAIVEWGSPEQQQDLIPGFLSDNSTRASIALNEPVPLFSPYTLQTKAVRDGDFYILNGVKHNVPMAKEAAFFLVLAETSDKGIQAFIVDNNVQGLELGDDRSMGLNAARLCKMKLNNIKVHRSAILGGDQGINYDDFISYSKLGWCALATGCCQAVLDYVIEYCNNRIAFGEPITHRQAVAFMIADIKIEVDGMRLLTQRAASRAEQGLDFRKEAYLAHLQCSDKGMQIGSNGVQLLGGHGYIRDYPVQRWYRDLRAVAVSYNGLHL